MNTQHSAGPKDREPGATGPSTESIEPVSAKPDRPSLPQIAAGALTAVSATALLSFLGVWGTIFGMGLLSVLTVLGNYMYSSFIHRTTQKVKHARPLHPDHEAGSSGQEVSTHDDGGSAGPATITSEQPDTADPHDAGAADAEDEEGSTSRWRAAWRSMVQRYGRRRIVVSIATVFVLLAGTVTVIELAAGRAMADIVRNESGGGTSLFGGSASEDSDTGDPDETGDSGGTNEREESPEQQNQDEQQDQQNQPNQDQPNQDQQQNDQPPAEDLPDEEPEDTDQQDEQPPAEEPNSGD